MQCPYLTAFMWTNYVEDALHGTNKKGRECRISFIDILFASDTKDWCHIKNEYHTAGYY